MQFIKVVGVMFNINYMLSYFYMSFKSTLSENCRPCLWTSLLSNWKIILHSSLLFDRHTGNAIFRDKALEQV